jgi:hypothetical protein
MRILLLLACCLLAACSQEALLQRLTPKADDDLARHFIDSIRTGNYNDADKLLDSSLAASDRLSGLRSLHVVLDHGEPLQIEEIGCNVSGIGGERKVNISYQIHFAGKWVIGNVLIKRQAETATILGAHFREIPDSLEALNRFSLSGKSPLFYAFFLACIVIPCFIIFTLVVCIRTPVRRKWLWILFILFGLVQFRLNWTTGQWDVQPISFVLLGSGSSAAGVYAPWILNFGLPVGAFFLLIYGRKKKTPIRYSLPSVP